MRVFLILLFAVFGCSVVEAQEIDDDLDILLQNVNKLRMVSIPGTLIVFGPRAFSVIGAFASVPANITLPIVAASRRGTGRIVVYGMERYFSNAGYENPLDELSQLILNSCLWATRSNTTTRRALVHVNYINLTTLLLYNGFTISLFDETLLDNQNFVNQYDVIVMDLNIISSLQAANLDLHLRLGGGVVTGSTGYQYNNEVAMTEWQGNNFLKRTGITFMGLWAYAGQTATEGFNASRIFVQDANSYPSWKILKDHIVNGTPIDGGSTRLTQLLEVVELAIVHTRTYP